MDQPDEGEGSLKSKENVQATITVAQKVTWCITPPPVGRQAACPLEGAQCRANLILLPDTTLVNISKSVYIFLILYSSGI